MTFAGVLRRVWMPLVVLAVIGGAGFTVSRVHVDFGSERHRSDATAKSSDAQQVNPKSVVHEVFGPVGTVADIRYFDVNSDPRRVDRARLPWSLKIAASMPAVVGDVVAQGDGTSVGCRIVVDGRVKAERITNEVDAYTHGLVGGA